MAQQKQFHKVFKNKTRHLHKHIQNRIHRECGENFCTFTTIVLQKYDYENFM